MKIRFILAFLVIFILIVTIFSYEKEQKISSYLSSKTERYVSLYSSIYNGYKDKSEIIHSILTDNRDIIDIYKNANSSDKDIQDEARKKLYNYLQSRYKKLKEFDLKQLHFHLKNNDSFLRMHRPNKFGDNLTDIRKTVAYVNKNQKPIDGFEEGRIYNGYRFVFPIIDKNQHHLGSVEVSFSAKAITSALMKHHDILSNFLINKKVVDDKVFNSEKGNYTNSPLKDYYFDKEVLKEVNKFRTAKSKQKPAQITIQTASKKMSSGESFSIYDINRDQVVTFIAIKNPITKDVVSYLTICDKTKYIHNKSLNTSLIIFGTTFSVFIFLMFIYRELMAKKKLLLEKEKMLGILDTQSTIILLTDGVHIKDCNKRFLEFFGYEKFEDFTKDHDCICEYFEEGRDFLQMDMGGLNWVEYIEQNPTKLHRVKMTGVDDTTRVFQLEFNTYSTKKGGEHGVVITLSDITKMESLNTELKIATLEAANVSSKLHHSNISLEKEISQAVKHIEDQHIQHKEDIVKNTKFNVIGQMAAGITHEINTPLTYIKGTTEMSRYDLEDMPDNEFKQRLLDDNEKVMSGVNRIGIIVESMREMSQKTTGEKENTNIYATLVTVLRMIFNRSKQISNVYLNGEVFDLETSDKDKYNFIALVQKQRIEQVWTIILNNALDELVKVDNFDNRRIDIQISNKDDSVSVEFKDNAGGIDEEIIDDIFEPFISTKESSGIGIGLNVAKRILDEHDASIEATNKDDGACFTVTLSK